MNRLSATITLLAGLCFSMAVHAGEPDFPVPRNAKVSIVSKNMVAGGKTMTVRQFYTRDKMKKVKEFYRTEWEREEFKGLPAYTETTAVEPWFMISRLEDATGLQVVAQHVGLRLVQATAQGVHHRPPIHSSVSLKMHVK